MHPILAAALVAVLTVTACAQAGTDGPVEAPEVSRAATGAAVPITRASAADLACLAEAIYFEAGQSREGFEAVAHVVMNRARDPRFPVGVCGVIGDRCQFSYRCEGKSLALANAERRARAQSVADAVLAGGAPDPTRGALFFHAASVAPAWFSTRARVGEFGGNVFYR